ncbi:GntR family transcriptional regulator [Mycobacterium sp. 1164966.3]|uniref:FadR/GntR family transcriptional regulator n=1 Tax=Mycobacterium sp. 1164966.3 TaxID=1856861 RepID=UPI0008015EFC|nr:FCD domain-containing protein [Mycobacterium sp. 1164966.3]OBA79985.1 GntR family transcriptional regulator [Mycobacterium sp. 1164966.3]
MSVQPVTGRGDKRASRVARSIEADIVRRGWTVGESLGSEHSLQQRYGVSRSVLREAVRLVEHHQVARMRRGPNGGLLICEPDAGPATRAVVIYLEHLATTIEEVLNARSVLEPLAASLAAEHLDEPGIERLRAVLRAEAHWQPGQPAPRDEFHVALAEQSRNPVLHLFVDVLMRLTRRYLRDRGSGAAAEAIDRMRRRCSEDHSGIVAAVTAGDFAGAKTLTEQHVEAVSAWLQTYRAPAATDRARQPPRVSHVEATREKLAEVLAATIGDEIAAAGWQVGSVFGTETALLERYGVSRAVFREAVRLLEFHAVAHMRRGPGGGLIVTKPRVQASIDTIALYLQYRQPSREDLRCVRDAIEIDNVSKVTAMVAGVAEPEPEVAAFLESAEVASAREPDDVRQAGVEEYRFHRGLSRLAGNAVLDLFLRIIVELSRRHWASTGQALPTWSDVVAVEHAHCRILEAIAAGDESLARHRIRRHLDAAASWWL